MKINPDPSQVASALSDSKSPSTSAQASGTSGAQATAAAPAGSSIEISSASRGLQSTDATDSASFDSARVDQIKQAITQGRFQVNAHVVADKLIASAQDLVSSALAKGR
jgi:negative regulator of flagellin synthesis FlgM